MYSTMTMDLAERILERLGFSERPACTLDGLNTLYRAWCRNIPFDNIHKRYSVDAGDTGPFPKGEPAEFFESYLAHGTGGTCWPTSSAIVALTTLLGFSVQRAAGSVVGTPDQNFPNHGTPIATFGDKSYLIDSVIFTEAGVPLVKGQAVTTPDPVHGVRVVPHGEYWTIFWRPGHSRAEMEFQLQHIGVDQDFYRARYASTRKVSIFNTALYTRKNLPDGGIITWAVGQLFVTDPQGNVTSKAVEDRKSLLIERFGYSEEIVARLPQDVVGDSFG